MEKFGFKSFPHTYERVWEVRRLLPQLIKRGKEVSESIAKRNAENNKNYSAEYYLGDTKDAYLARLYNIYGEDIVCWSLVYPWTSEESTTSIDTALRSI